MTTKTKKQTKAVWKRYPHSAVDELFVGGDTLASVEQLPGGVEWVAYVTPGMDIRSYGKCSTVKEAKDAAEAAAIKAAETIIKAIRARKAGAR